MATQDEYIRTALRVPRELHEQIHEAAKATGHSFNAEIIGRLQASFDTQPPETLGDLGDKIDQLQGQIEQLTARSAAAFLLAVQNKEIVYEDGKMVAGPNFKLGTQLPAKPPGKRKKP